VLEDTDDAYLDEIGLRSDLIYLENFVNDAEWLAQSPMTDVQSEYGYQELSDVHMSRRMSTSSSPADIGRLDEAFCSNFTCCGLILPDMHALLQHYEDAHVRVEMSDDDSDTVPAVMVLEEQAAYDASVYGPPSALSGRRTQRYSSMDDASTIADSVYRPSGADVIAAFDDSIIRNASAVPDKASLVRRIGDVEDDLPMHVLENLTEEIEQSQKRLKHFHGDGEHHSIVPSLVTSSLTDDEMAAGGSDDDDKDEDGAPSKTSKLEKPTETKKMDPATAMSQLDLALQALASGQFTGDFSANLASALSALAECADKNDKPYRCTYPGCDKAYKNPNGLKYHNLHGHCGGDEDDLDLGELH
jgi:transcription factor SFP1